MHLCQWDICELKLKPRESKEHNKTMIETLLQVKLTYRTLRLDKTQSFTLHTTIWFLLQNTKLDSTALICLYSIPLAYSNPQYLQTPSVCCLVYQNHNMWSYMLSVCSIMYTVLFSLDWCYWWIFHWVFSL